MRRALLVLAAIAVGCGGNGKEWVKSLPDEHDPVQQPGWNNDPAAPEAPDPLGDAPDAGPRSELAPAPAWAPARDGDEPPGAERVTYAGDGAGLLNDLFRNTYYDFPKEGRGKRDATVFDASCHPIANVTKAFHDQVCVQGSGRLASGQTISFAKRGCECAATCPRTGQKICFEALDPAAFPAGRGATGKPITPLRTVAVDVSVIPLGSVVFIPELVGLPRPDGSAHDGCFVAEDKGIRVQGRQVDVFTGDPGLTARWNKLFPSNRGVHVRLNEPRCMSAKSP
ncbi:MAG TPA: 3D domain-containing protein [Minicystis sp.]|nr:3D domain-containing protein [Minicystis sp.]